MREDLPVAHVARDHRETPARGQRLVEMLPVLHDDPGSDLFVAEIGIAHRIHKDLGLVQEDLQRQQAHVITVQCGPQLDGGDLPVVGQHEPCDGGQEPGQVQDHLVRQHPDEREHADGSPVAQLQEEAHHCAFLPAPCS